MSKQTYNNVPVTVFTPVKVADVTTAGLEGEHTAFRMGPAYGVSYKPSKAMAPSNIGQSMTDRLSLMQPSNPALAYYSMEGEV